MQGRAFVGHLPFQRAISWVAVLFAVSSWVVVLALMADPLGPRGGAGPLTAAGPSVDPCALREPQPAGTDTRCAFPLARRDGRPFTVDLEQRWEGNVLTQWLNVRDGGAEAAHFVFARSTGARPARVQRLFAVAVDGGDEHLTYLIGLCGAPSCGTSEIWIVGAPDGHIVPLLKLTLGQGAQLVLGPDGALIVTETADRLGLGTQLIRTLRWQEGRYRVEQTTRQRLGPR